MDFGDEGRITQCGGYVRVDFGSSNASELSAVYQAFASFCHDHKVTSALLKAGDNDPKGHYRLRDALTTMAQLSQLPAEFKLALIPSMCAIEAVDWLEGRSRGGCAAS